MMASQPPVTLRRPPHQGGYNMEPSSTTEDGASRRQARPKSTSYEALRSALYQLTRMADFKVEALLGSGFFADVYKVKHRSTGEQMVLKMNKSRKTSKTMLAEIQLLNRLSHPNILRFKGSCVHEGQLHALTEYINGGSLEEMLMDKSIHLSWSVRLQITRDIVRGMVYLHSKNVFHRDLNPKNCLIQRERDGSIRTIVADFGLAAKIKQRRRRSYTEVVGSAYWMAPECLYGKSYCEQADVFSFGITMAEIIARIPADPDYMMPRRKDFGLDMGGLRLICQDCPEPLLQLVEKCCQIEPDERPNFEEVLEDLESITLSDDYLDENELKPASLCHASSQKDLRSSMSEPILRISDNLLVGSVDESQSREEESEDNSEIRVCTLRLDSVGSSNGSSFGSTVDDGYGCGIDLERSSDDSPQLDVFPRGTDLKQTESKNDNDCVSQNDASVSIGEGIDKKIDCPTLSSKTEDGRSVDANRRESVCDIPQKSVSLDSSASGYIVSLDRNCLDTSSRERNPSIQTLLASEGAIEASSEVYGTSSTKQRGGDSGIDPGEVDIFKFPQQHDHQKLHVSNSLSTTELSTVSGDRTPLGCLSPEPNHSAAECAQGGSVSPSGCIFLETDKKSKKGIPISPILSPSCSTPNLTECLGQRKPVAATSVLEEVCSNPSPTHSSFSHSRTSSVEDTSQGDPSILVTLREHSTSPLEQSWASSEFSFTLPSPSTPWAPPSSPNPPSNRHSLPSSPAYRHSPYHSFRRHNSPHQSAKSHTHPHRYSQEISNTQNYHLHKNTNSSSSRSRPKSCRNSALFPETSDKTISSSSMVTDLQLDFERVMKTVHFGEDNFGERDTEDFAGEDDPNMTLRLEYASREGMARQRSKSSPSRRIRKTSAYSSLAEDNRNSKTLREYGISLKTDLIDFDTTCSSKYYKITQTSTTRLSSSTPDLSKFSLQSAPY